MSNGSRLDNVRNGICRFECYLFGGNDTTFKPSKWLLLLPFWTGLIMAPAILIANTATEYEMEELLWIAGYAMAVVCGLNLLLHLGHLWKMGTSLRQIGYFIFALFFSALCYALTFGIAFLLLIVLIVCLLLFILGIFLGGASRVSSSSASASSGRSYSSGPEVGESTFSSGYDYGGSDDNDRGARSRGITLNNGDTVEEDILTGTFKSKDPIGQRVYKKSWGTDDFEEQ